MAAALLRMPDLPERVSSRELAGYGLHVSGEIPFSLSETRHRTCKVTDAFRPAERQVRYVLLALRADVRLPVETLHLSLLFGELDKRICVILRTVEIGYPVDLPFDKISRYHLGLDLVHSGKGVVFLEIEKSRGATEGIEALQRGGGIEIRHYLCTTYLVEAHGILLYDDEGVGHQAGLVHPLVLDRYGKAVRRVLPVALIPHDGRKEKPCKGIQVSILQRVAACLHVRLEHADMARSPEEAYGCRVAAGQRIPDKALALGGKGLGLRDRVQHGLLGPCDGIEPRLLGHGQRIKQDRLVYRQRIRRLFEHPFILLHRHFIVYLQRFDIGLRRFL